MPKPDSSLKKKIKIVIYFIYELRLKYATHFFNKLNPAIHEKNVMYHHNHVGFFLEYKATIILEI